ncbi:MAG: hypothetical protein ABII00_09235 [Elusimicrobiota bacterium]
MRGILALVACLAAPLHGGDWTPKLSGYAAGEARGFAAAPPYQGQVRNTVSAVFEPELHLPLGREELTATFSPFGRLDSADPERTYFDVRELFVLWHGGRWEARAGVDKVFWGVTESAHLVDIVNQTDTLGSFDGEDKLGQPMLKLSLSPDLGTFDLFLLPYFRERTFAGARGRLRGPLVAKNSLARYESAAGEWHQDFAVRYSRSVSVLDIGLSHFHGTGREPTLLQGVDPSGTPVYIPFYEQIDQTGLDAQLTAGSWLWKLEAIRRNGEGPRAFVASALGLEYSISGVLGSPIDLGLLAEWLLDDRHGDALRAADNDITAGFRLAFNDVQGTELLAFVVHDYRNASRVLSVEAGRRLTDNWKAEAQGFMFLGAAPGDPTYLVRDDDHLEIRLAYYF